MIRRVKQEDAAAIVAIYNPFVLETTVSFEESAVSAKEMVKRIESTTAHYPWLVYESEGKVAGYAYATRWRTRAAYDHTVETTIYLAPEARGHGFGTRLYQALMDELRIRGFHTAIGGIALPNPASVALHEKVGFVKASEMREVGSKFGRWVDFGFWQRML